MFGIKLISDSTLEITFFKSLISVFAKILYLSVPSFHTLYFFWLKSTSYSQREGSINILTVVKAIVLTLSKLLTKAH